jgi:hypothetical protein
LFADPQKPALAERCYRIQVVDQFERKWGYDPIFRYQARGNLDSAKLWLRKAVDIAERLHEVVKLRTLHSNGQALMVEAGRPDEARQFSEKLGQLEARTLGASG